MARACDMGVVEPRRRGDVWGWRGSYRAGVCEGPVLWGLQGWGVVGGLCALGAAVCVCTPGELCPRVPVRMCRGVGALGRAVCGCGVRSGVRVLQHTVAAVGAGTVPPAWGSPVAVWVGRGTHSPQQQLLLHTNGEVIMQTWAGIA